MIPIPEKRERLSRSEVYESPPVGLDNVEIFVNKHENSMDQELAKQGDVAPSAQPETDYGEDQSIAPLPINTVGNNLYTQPMQDDFGNPDTFRPEILLPPIDVMSEITLPQIELKFEENNEINPKSPSILPREGQNVENYAPTASIYFQTEDELKEMEKKTLKGNKSAELSQSFEKKGGSRLEKSKENRSRNDDSKSNTSQKYTQIEDRESPDHMMKPQIKKKNRKNEL